MRLATFRIIRRVSIGWLCLTAGAALAADMPGANDHPLVKRFAGSSIIACDVERFDSCTLQTGPSKRYDARESQPEYAGSETIEGAVTRLWYATELKAEPTLMLRVVGRTDDRGTLDANIASSKRRAEAVDAALFAQYDVVAARLSALGVADLAPVSSNADEAGRAKNRRVGWVPQ